MKINKLIILLLFVNLSYSQSAIVAGGTENITIGETFPLMQQVDTIIQGSLGVPEFEPPPVVKPPKKKPLSFFEKLILMFKNLFR